MNRRRERLIAPLLVVLFAAACVWLPLGAALGLGSFWVLGSVALLKKPGWRDSALVLASVLAGLAGFQGAFGLIDPGGPNWGVTKVTTPQRWAPDDPVLGYRPRPNTTVDVTATYGDELLYRATYHIDATGARVTPGSALDGPTWLFIGDSVMFGEGLDDSQTLPSQFAERLQPPAHVVNLGVSGYGPNHLVRALETGAYDGYVVGKVAAVVTWINSGQVLRVTGDGGWLTLSPRYEFGPDGQPVYTGSFLRHRLSHPFDGIYYFARSRFSWVQRVVDERREHELQGPLYVALLKRLQELVQQKWNAPLVIIYDWDDGTIPGQIDAYRRWIWQEIHALGAPMLSLRDQMDFEEGWDAYFIPHDGHANARMDRLLAEALLKRVQDLRLQ